MLRLLYAKLQYSCQRDRRQLGRYLALILVSASLSSVAGAQPANRIPPPAALTLMELGCTADPALFFGRPADASGVMRAPSGDVLRQRFGAHWVFSIDGGDNRPGPVSEIVLQSQSPPPAVAPWFDRERAQILGVLGEAATTTIERSNLRYDHDDTYSFPADRQLSLKFLRGRLVEIQWICRPRRG